MKTYSMDVVSNDNRATTAAAAAAAAAAATTTTTTTTITKINIAFKICTLAFGALYKLKFLALPVTLKTGPRSTTSKIFIAH